MGMFEQNKICKCLQKNYIKPLMQRFGKICRKIKIVQKPKFDRFLLECMLKIFGNDCNEKIAKMYNDNEVFFDWMVKYIQHCNKLSHLDECFVASFDNLLIALRGVTNTINGVNDICFYIMYNQRKQQKFQHLVALLSKMKKINVGNGNNERIEFEINLILEIMKVFNALCNKEEGRKYLLFDKMKANHENFGQILSLIGCNDDDKYEELRVFIDDYFRKLVQQKQDNEEQKEIEDKENEKRIKREEIEKKKKAKLDKIRKEKQEKERKEREAKEAEERKKNKQKPMPKDGDEYLNAMSSDNEEDKKKKIKKKKMKKKKTDYTRKILVSQREPAKFNALTLKNVFGDALTDKEIKAILSLPNNL